MVYLVKPNYPTMYKTSKMKETHAVDFAASRGAKYYTGTKTENIWSQELMKKQMNTAENVYLLQCERGTHKSIPLYEKACSEPPGMSFAATDISAVAGVRQAHH